MLLEILYPAFLWLLFPCVVGIFAGSFMLSVLEGHFKKVSISILIGSIVVGTACLFLGIYGMRASEYPTCPTVCQKPTINQFYNAERK